MMGSRVIILGFLCLCLLISCQSESDDSKLFTKLSSGDTRISFKNTLRETEEFNVMKYGYFYNGGGVAVGDINNDSLPYIYFTGTMMASHLYINKGDMQFEQIAEQANVAAAGLWIPE